MSNLANRYKATTAVASIRHADFIMPFTFTAGTDGLSVSACSLPAAYASVATVSTGRYKVTFTDALASIPVVTATREAVGASTSIAVACVAVSASGGSGGVGTIDVYTRDVASSGALTNLQTGDKVHVHFAMKGSTVTP